MNPAHPLTQRRLAMVEKRLRGQPMHMRDLAAAIHMSVRWTREYVVYLHGERKLHITRWVYEGISDYPIAVYAWGAGLDARKPKARTPRQKGIKLRAARKADPDRRDAFLSRDRARKRKIKPDPLVGALFGRAP